MQKHPVAVVHLRPEHGIDGDAHADCAIRRQAGDCVMPREGIFAVVLTEGEAKAGDLIVPVR